MDRHAALLTGIPRSGTTLCCRLLNRCDDTLALVEPMKVQDFDPGAGVDAACEGVVRFVADARAKALAGQSVPTMHSNGALAENVIGSQQGENGLRKAVVAQGEVVIDKPLSEGFSLIVKHNAFFTALLPRLRDYLPVYAVVRNPLAVLASWNSVNLPVNHGRVPAGERYAPELKRRLDAEPDRLQRQLVVLDWFCQAFERHVPQECLIRYESLVQGEETPLQALVPNDGWRGLTDVNRAQNRQYATDMLARLAGPLLASDGAYWRFYDRREAEALLA
jgi:hypothetical protein